MAEATTKKTFVMKKITDEKNLLERRFEKNEKKNGYFTFCLEIPKGAIILSLGIKEEGKGKEYLEMSILTSANHNKKPLQLRMFVLSQTLDRPITVEGEMKRSNATLENWLAKYFLFEVFEEKKERQNEKTAN